MKVLGVICATALLLALSAAVPAYAQDEHQEDQAKPEKQAQQAKPAQHEQQAKPAKQEQAAKPEQRQEQAKSEKQQRNNSAKQEQQQQVKGQQEQRQANNQKQQQARSEKQEQQARQVKQEDRGRTAGQQHVQRTSAEEQRQRAVPALRLSARGNARIPDDRFRSNFGRGHEFRIGNPRVVDGYSRFQYGGYWFGFVQPWPVDWYYTDDVYVDYINGQYYLCNPSYPGTQIAISVVL